MLAIGSAVLLFAFLMSAITLYGYRRFAKPGRVVEQLGTPVMTMQTMVADPLDPRRDNVMVQVFQTLGEYVPISPEDAIMTRRYLIAAGLRTEQALMVFFGIKLILCVGLVLAAVLFGGYLTSVTVLRVVLTVAAGLLGFFGPNLILDQMVLARQEELKLALPDALDLLVVCVEAGLGLDQAIQNVSRELHLTHPAICEELGLVTLEMRAGKRRAEALRNLADRTGEPELRKLVAILIQTDRFGTSMGDSLRTHSEFMRIRRRQDAEERAGKVGVKLVFPIFFFILPSMLIVAAGPGLLQVFKQLFPMMREFRIQ
jgi:tight adherence protein C